MADPWGASWLKAQTHLRLVLHTPAGWTSDIDPGEPGHAGRWSVTPDEGIRLRDMVRGRGVVEIGTGLGISTRYMAESALWIVTVDVDPWVWQQVWPDLADLENVFFSSSTERISDLTVWPNVVFIDGQHDALSIQRDVRTAMRLLSAGGEIILHDTVADMVRAGIAACGVKVELHNESHNGLGIIYFQNGNEAAEAYERLKAQEREGGQS